MTNAGTGSSAYIERSRASNLPSIVLGMYLGISPVYWWPYVSEVTFGYVKLLLAMTGFAAVVIAGFSRRSARIPYLFMIGSYSAIVICSVPGLLQSETSTTVFKDITLGFIAFWSGLVLRQTAPRAFLSALLLGAGIVAAHAVLTVVNYAVGWPAWRAPGAIAELYVNGFTSKRTGWSNGIALFIPILFAGVLLSWKQIASSIASATAAGAIIASQFVCAGRAGLLGSVTAVVWMMLRTRRFGLLAISGTLCTLLALGNWSYVTEQMRFQQIEAQQQADFKTLDAVGSGRLRGNVYALRMIAASPMLGHGFEESRIGGGDIHNLWLRLAVESGVMLPVVLAIFVTVCVRAGMASLRTAATPDSFSCALISLAVVGIGIVISMFEPATILGAFQNSAVWWVCAGALMAKSP